MTDKLSLSFGSKTDAGKTKQYNSDAIIDFPIEDGHVFVVCDGHDGEQGHGALAAKLTAESIKKYFYNKTYKDLQKALTNAITFANYSVYEQSQKDEKYQGMGSTIAVLIVKGSKVYYAYAGDSRIYKLINKKLQPLTRDHVEDVENPKSSPVSVLIGRAKDIKFGVCKQPLTVNEGDHFLLCSDGLTDVLSDKDIEQILVDENTSAEHKAINLVDASNEKEGADNISVYNIDFNKPVVVEKVKTTKISKKTIVIAVVTLLVLLIASVLFVNKDKFVLVEKENIEIIPADKNAEIPIEEKNYAENQTMDIKVLENQAEELEYESIEPQSLNETIYYKHHVQYGENLYRLGLRYNIPQQTIIEINKSKATNLVAGSYLQIPVTAIYTVKAGDSYSVVSDKFNVKISVIKKANKIDNNQPFTAGQELIIPLP